MVSQILGDRYEVQQQLSKKAGRQTLLVRDLETQKLAVIKLLTFDSDFEWDDLKLFEREAAILKTLSHPAIPQYLDYLELDGKNGKGFAIVQTYIEAKSLEQHLKAGRSFSETEIKEIAKALLEILTYLHGHTPPVIHRDIKPSNILLANRSGHSVGQVYLVDFGSVQTLAGKEGGTVTVVGTYGYMPPEQFGGRAVPASDIYSLGATLIYLVTGSHPADLPQKNLKIQFEPAVNISQELTLWLKRMTEPSLERRLATVQDAFSALDKPQQRQLKTIEQTAVCKPGSSEILLAKNADYLEIFLKVDKNKRLILIKNSLIGCMILLTIVCTRVSDFNAQQVIILIGMVVIGMEIMFKSGVIKEKVSIIINKQPLTRESIIYIWMENKLVPEKYQKCVLNYDLNKLPIREINKLELVYSNLATAPHELIIWKGNRKYFEINQLNALELNLVASELSQRLRLPLDTKKLPPSWWRTLRTPR
jgi:serine/threonine protein kinase